MNLLIAIDGSQYTGRALEFLAVQRASFVDGPRPGSCPCGAGHPRPCDTSPSKIRYRRLLRRGMCEGNRAGKNTHGKTFHDAGAGAAASWSRGRRDCRRGIRRPSVDDRAWHPRPWAIGSRFDGVGCDKGSRDVGAAGAARPVATAPDCGQIERALAQAGDSAGLAVLFSQKRFLHLAHGITR